MTQRCHYNRNFPRTLNLDLHKSGIPALRKDVYCLVYSERLDHVKTYIRSCTNMGFSQPGNAVLRRLEHLSLKAKRVSEYFTQPANNSCVHQGVLPITSISSAYCRSLSETCSLLQLIAVHVPLLISSG